MTNEQLLAEIKEANMTYLMLAQNLIRQDKSEALFRLGMSEESADLIGTLSPAQIVKIASSNIRLNLSFGSDWHPLGQATLSRAEPLIACHQ